MKHWTLDVGNSSIPVITADPEDVLSGAVFAVDLGAEDVTIGAAGNLWVAVSLFAADATPRTSW